MVFGAIEVEGVLGHLTSDPSLRDVQSRIRRRLVIPVNGDYDMPSLQSRMRRHDGRFATSSKPIDKRRPLPIVRYSLMPCKMGRQNEEHTISYPDSFWPER